MPRSLDPSSRLTMVLACDLDKDPQPRIFAKQPTLNQQKKLIRVLSSLEKSNMLEGFDAIQDAASELIQGWENIPIPFSREAIGDVLTMEEVVEVLGFLVSTSEATTDDKKKSESPLLSDAVSCASPALVSAGL
jgi:hypothetical protein